MKTVLTWFLAFCTLHSFSQQKDRSLDRVATDHSNVKDSISSLNISNPALKDSTNFHSSDTITTSIFTQINKLDEVYVDPKSSFDAVSLGIIKKKIEPLTSNERKLYTAGDFKPVHLLSILGGSLAVDPIINKISGRTKRLKKYVQLEKKERNLLFLEGHFTEYMLNHLNIPEETIGRFLIYLIEHERLQDLIDRKDFGELHFLIGDAWFGFEDFQNKPILKDIEEIRKE